MSVRHPHALVTCLAIVLAAVVAGCGGGGGAVAVPELTSFSSVAEKSSASDSARFALTLDVTVPGVDRSLSFGAEGGFDGPANRSRIEVDLSGLADLFKGLGSAFGGGATGEMGSPDDWRLEAIQDGGTAYIRFPLLAERLPAGKAWIKGDASDLEGAGGSQLGQFGSLAGTDPREAFGLLKAVSGSIEAVGSDTIRGVSTSHYRATIDPKKVMELVPAAQVPGGLEGLEQQLAEAGLGDLPVDVWIDADQRIRKLSVAVDAKEPGGDATMKAALVIEVYDYGKQIEIEIPPAGEVMDAAALKTLAP